MSDFRQLAADSARTTRPSGHAWQRGTCKLCLLRTGKADRRGSFSFNPGTGGYHCFKCGVAGNLDGKEFEDLRKEGPEDAVVREVMRAPEGFYLLMEEPGLSAISAQEARDYLDGRGLTNRALWREAKIGCCLTGRYEGRVIVPILAPDGTWLDWVGRAWVNKAEVPYLYPKGMERRGLLYNHAALLVETERPLFVVEGVMDALALWPDATAVLGKPSEDQIYALSQAPRPIAVCLDGDAWEEGQAFAWRLRIEGQRAGSIRLPPRLDPDEMPREWLDSQAQEALEA